MPCCQGLELAATGTLTKHIENTADNNAPRAWRVTSSFQPHSTSRSRSSDFSRSRSPLAASCSRTRMRGVGKSSAASYIVWLLLHAAAAGRPDQPVTVFGGHDTGSHAALTKGRLRSWMRQQSGAHPPRHISLCTGLPAARRRPRVQAPAAAGRAGRCLTAPTCLLRSSTPPF